MYALSEETTCHRKLCIELSSIVITGGLTAKSSRDYQGLVRYLQFVKTSCVRTDTVLLLGVTLLLSVINLYFAFVSVLYTTLFVHSIRLSPS
jgi:hypothetical protein